jgi:coenzyme PQQ precursor peptide PqqA
MVHAADQRKSQIEVVKQKVRKSLNVENAPRVDPARYAMVIQPTKENGMKWTAPAYTDLRFGFEITMYIANR